MRIEEMFAKPIDRDLKGVIKVGQDQNENVLQELEEYVVTRELSRHFRDFFANYKRGVNGRTDKMGVWISGFFGSGKSHFLKILSYLLENKEIEGKRAIDFFTDGEKITDAMVIADIKLAGDTPADVVLFNIDSKSSADSKSNKEAILDVFLKVFNEMQGFCGEIPLLADLERKLANEAKYESFKKKFATISGNEWENARGDFFFIQDDLVQVLVELDEMSEGAARNWCEKAAQQYNISIEKFAELVREYCEKKEKNHHIIFLVDEIGQYIGGDSKLMLNLQTVTEDLGRLCEGKAWVVVTSQQDIDSIAEIIGSDFSKIQGRFDTRLSLSSANVDEVIKKRILAKEETASEMLRLYYGQNETIIKNLIQFVDTAEKKLYTDREDFVAVYPFIPYQFNLLGQVLTAIREHGASGKHLSEGERSMIALFKESAVSIAELSEGALVPFNTFYDALHQFIDHTHSIVISRARENGQLKPFDVELLKVLFMIKYVKEIKANSENLTSLLISNVSDDRVILKKEVEESLRRLIGQTLIQKNGDIYTFLTNEEQDINRAILQENVVMSERIHEASSVIFEDIFTDKKYRYSARYNFSFNQIVDDTYYKNVQSNAIGIKIITPYSDQKKSDDVLRMLSSQEPNVIICLPEDTTFLDEITETLKIKKFITKQGTNLPKSFESIKSAKQIELTEKKERIRIFIEEALKNADIYIDGTKAEIGAKDPVSRINEALGKLVNTIYHKLSYMETAPTDADIINIFNTTNQLSMELGEETGANKLALSDMLQYAEMNTLRHIKTSMKALKDQFGKAPYGFTSQDVEWLVATLFKQGKVSFTLNSKVISLVDTDKREIINYIVKKEHLEKLLIEKRERATERQIRSVKEVMKDFFKMVSIPEEDDELVAKFKSKSRDIEAKTKNIILMYHRADKRYPGEDVLKNAQDLLTRVSGKTSPSGFFAFVDQQKDEFLDLAEDLEPVFIFFDGEQKTFFEKAIKVFDIFERSKTYLTDKEIISVANQINSIIKNRNPYSEIQRIPELLENFNDRYVVLLENEAAPIRKQILDDKKIVFDMLAQDATFEKEFKDHFFGLFSGLNHKLERSNDLATVKYIRYESDSLKIRCLDEMEIFKQEINESEVREDTSEITAENTIKQPLQKKNKNISMQQITLSKSFRLETESDIDQFLAECREKLIKELEQDTVINLIP